MAKIRVGLVFGGRSGEHEVSVRSAASVYRALDKNKYDVELFGVDESNKWQKVNPEWLPISSEMKRVGGGSGRVNPWEVSVDVFFPIIHGTYGEDGTMQGLFELLDVAYVGAGVLGSAVGMDKDVAKRLLKADKIPTARHLVIMKAEISDKLLEIVGRKLGWPIFVKPANMGSSVGVSRVNNLDELKKSVAKASQYDTKVILEEFVEGREIEVSVLGNDEPIASLPGEVRPTHDFYDYEAKYLDENGAILEVPAKLGKLMVAKIQSLAVRAYKTLECCGMARVDMFVTPKGRIVLNEINTLPGFTNISMYPKLWEVSGISYPDLLERLIDLALEKKRNKDKLKRSFG